MNLFPLALAGALALGAMTAQAQEVTVGVTTTGVPFTFVDTASQQPTGAMVDLAAAIAE
ncbi:MAG TPA: amino acid ABC transporter substrate-binding protein, partial [Citreicella sp.]|nr:amino acid ABC transporter substrate-binding protein [Citreicella sp.]